LDFQLVSHVEIPWFGTNLQNQPRRFSGGKSEPPAVFIGTPLAPFPLAFPYSLFRYSVTLPCRRNRGAFFTAATRELFQFSAANFDSYNTHLAAAMKPRARRRSLSHHPRSNTRATCAGVVRRCSARPSIVSKRTGINSRRNRLAP
jgi:hypothetical protein